MEQRLAYTIADAARLVGISRPTMYNWTRLPGFPVVKIGGVTRIPAAAFERWLEERAGGFEV